MNTVVIFGRPNVGKSSLMNRILGRREAIVEDEPGITRDRKVASAEWQGFDFDITDTGGWLASGSELDAKVTDQASKAIESADVCLFVVDGRTGITEEDRAAARSLRTNEDKVILVVNKVDTDDLEALKWDFLQLGLGDPWAISCLHGKGVADMLDEVVSRFDEAPDVVESQEPSERVFAIAIVGRPNVGKSTLFNSLIGEERSITHDMAGTTRDTVDVTVSTEAGEIKFLDTAGMRRKSKIDEDTEFFSALRSLKSIDGADIALLVVDASEGVTAQDVRLAERIDAAGCPIVIVCNKVDLISTESKLSLNDALDRKLSFLPNPKVHKISATSGAGLNKILPSLSDAMGVYTTRIPTQDVNKIIRVAQQAQPAPGGARILYATQGATDPPTFTLFVNRKLHDTYLRYIERKIRESFKLGSTPIKMRVRLRNE